jgi:nucleoside-diphosphate-sugar epimerase
MVTFALGKPVISGRRAYVHSPLDVPHSWTAVADVARALVTVAADERGWGRAWLVPTQPAADRGQLAGRLADAAGAPSPKLTEITHLVLWAAGLFSPLIRELRTTRYQFARPFVLDASATTAAFRLTASPMDEVLRRVADRLRSETR